MSKIDLELEKARQDKDELAKELEKAENEATTTEMRRQIAFLKSTQSQANCTSQGQGMSFGNVTQIANIPSTASLGTSSNTTKKNVVGKTSNVNNQKNVGASSSQGFQKKPIFIERCRKICFLGIPRCPNEIPKVLRDKVTKFVGNNVITDEQHLRDFSDLLNDY